MTLSHISSSFATLSQTAHFNLVSLDVRFYAGFRCNGLSSSGYNHFGYYKEYVYNCQSLSQMECDAMAATHEVILKFVLHHIFKCATGHIIQFRDWILCN